MLAGYLDPQNLIHILDRLEINKRPWASPPAQGHPTPRPPKFNVDETLRFVLYIDGRFFISRVQHSRADLPQH